MVKVLCDNKRCTYHIFKEDEGEVYQNQCGNDEIEIGKHPGFNMPICYSFELKEE